MKIRNKKTGEITDNIFVYDGFICVDVWKSESGTYATLAELNKEWEDAEPAEPLIKDEKIRKAVRAWAEALDLRWFRRCSSVSAYTSRLTGHNAEGVCYTMELKPKDLYGEKITKDSYTLSELCGEGE